MNIIINQAKASKFIDEALKIADEVECGALTPGAYVCFTKEDFNCPNCILGHIGHRVGAVSRSMTAIVLMAITDVSEAEAMEPETYHSSSSLRELVKALYDTNDIVFGEANRSFANRSLATPEDRKQVADKLRDLVEYVRKLAFAPEAL